MSESSIPANYADLEIRILQRQEEGFPVELTVNHEQEYAGGHLDPSFLPWVPGTSARENGQRLFDWLFASDEFKAAWAEIRGRHPARRIRLRLDQSEPELHAIPWEMLRDESAASGQDLAATEATPFSRYLAGSWQPGSPIPKRPIKILVAISNPDLSTYPDLAQLDVEAEMASLQAAVEGLEVELTELPQPCTLSALEAQLKAAEYHILHFIGHGQVSKRSKVAQLYLAKDNDEVDLVPADRFADMLGRQLNYNDPQSDNRLRLIFLSSCQTAEQSPAGAFRGFAPELVHAGIPAVLAMQDLVLVETAQRFSHVFYRQLLSHGQVDVASNEARSTLLTEELKGAATPVLFMRVRSGMLLGQRGRIIGGNADGFWPFLLANIAQEACLPILGPRVNKGILPEPHRIAGALANKYQYPYTSPDRQSLAQIAQFVGLRDRALLQTDYITVLKQSLSTYLGITLTKEQRRAVGKASFSEAVQALDWAKKILEVQETQIHHQLAEIGFPLYLTTNFDNFMEEALRDHGATPSQARLRWEQQDDQVHYVLPTKPSMDTPLVFHLNEYDHTDNLDNGQRLILSEDDYLTHLVRLARDQEEILPTIVSQALSRKSLMFLGFSLDDWELRMILQGLLPASAQTGGKTHVGVQLEIDGVENIKNAETYLQSYLGQFKIDIYWGSVTQFVNELYTYWKEDEDNQDDDDDDDWDDSLLL